jgi:hypothetical protein
VLTLKETAAEFLAKKPEVDPGGVHAVAWDREHGIRVIEGACPLMFEPTADPGHELMRFFCTLAGQAPRRV